MGGRLFASSGTVDGQTWAARHQLAAVVHGATEGQELHGAPPKPGAIMDLALSKFCMGG